MAKDIQRNKEEIIEMFISQLGDNEILGKIFTIEQIKEKLNSLISEVRYKNLDFTGVNGSWVLDETGIGFLIIGDRMQDDSVIVHELLHVLSTTIIEKNEFSIVKSKCGYEICTLQELTGYNKAITEGITDILAEKITDTKKRSYLDEKKVCEILLRIIGEDIMLKKYFSEEVQNLDNPLDIFKDDLIRKYGEEVGNSINSDLVKILNLSDQKLISKKKIDNDGFDTIKATREINSRLLNIVNKAIDNEKDIDKKMKLCECFTYLDYTQYNQALNEIVNSDKFSYKQKIEIIRHINQNNLKQEYHFNISSEIIHKILFDFKEAEILSALEKKDLFFELKSKGNVTDIDMLYELYVNTGKISVTYFSKRNMLEESLVSIGLTGPLSTEDEIDERLSQVKYAKMGDYYKLSGVDDYKFKNLFFDKEGNIVRDDYLLFDPLTDEEIDENDEDVEILQFVLPKESIEAFGKNLKNKFKEYKDLYYKEPKAPNIYIIGNIARLEYNENHYEFFSIKSDGNMEKLEMRCTKKFYR